MFQPELSLIPQADGSFTLLVKALVPSTCYTAGPITPGLPPGTGAIPEVLPFKFEIAHHHGICAQLVHYISATVPGLRPTAGHSSILVFSIVDGKVAGHAAVSFPKIEALKEVVTTPVPGCTIIPDSVSAVVYSGLIGSAELRVSCLVSTPTPGYAARLEPATPQGFNPSILLLNLLIDPPHGQQIDVLSTIEARYEKPHYTGHYSDVTLLNGRQSVTVPVIVIFSAFEASRRYEFSTRGART
jgi:hypothetical protein